MEQPSEKQFHVLEPLLVRAQAWLRRSLGRTWAGRIAAFLQFWEIVVSGFVNNRCPVRATALAYTTLLALIPMIAVAASISTGILKSQGREPIDLAINKLVAALVPPETDLTTNTPTIDRDSETIVEGSTNRIEVSAETRRQLRQEIDKNRKQIVDKINESLQNINSGSLGVTGMVGLIVVAILLFSTIEATFNDIWGVKLGRSWVSRIVQYWATVTLGPLIPVIVFSLNIGSSLQSVQDWMEHNRLESVSQFAIEKVAPLAVLSFGFAFFYQLMPNTKVRWSAALVGGLTGGLLWQLNSALSIFYVSRVATYTKIYGSLGLVPVFLVGLYLSWLILLFGAQVAYAFQNRVAYLQEKEAQRINFLGREYLALRIMTLLGQRFDDPMGRPPGVIEISRILRVSTRLVDECLQAMVAGGLVLETNSEDAEYTLTRPLEKITMNDILMALRTARGKVAETADDFARGVVDVAFQNVVQAEQTVSKGTSLRQLVDQANAAGTRQDSRQAVIDS